MNTVKAGNQVAEVKITFFHLHSWNKWSVKYNTRQMDVSNRWHETLLQERDCKVCGFVQIHKKIT